MPKIEKIMKKEVYTLKKDAKISEAAKILAQRDHQSVVIVEGKKPVGIVTELDVLKHFLSKSKKTKVKDIMSSPVVTLKINESFERAGKTVDKKNFRKFPVVDKEGNLVGLVTENGLVQAINRNISFHRNLQNAILIAFVLFEFSVFVFYRSIVEVLPFLR